MRTLRVKIAEWVFNFFLKPFEKVIISQKVLAQHGKNPEVQKQFERSFGVDQLRRTAKQWQNLVRVYGIETVAKIENITEETIKLKCLKFSDRIKEEFKRK
jgi:hypothetical protein